MISIFKKRKAEPLRKNSLAFNIEPTFRCNLKCTTCPRNSVEGGHFDMTQEIFSRICEEIAFARNVDLTGWGEPLLHPGIAAMIHSFAGKGLPVSMTSNGTLLSSRMTSGLISAGLGKLAISVDGMRPRTYETIRRGAVYSQISENIKTAASLIKKESSSMELSLAFTIQKQNLADLELIVPWMREHGIYELHLKHLNVLSGSFEWDNSLISNAHDPDADPGLLRKAEEDIGKLQEDAAGAGFSVNFYSQLPMDDVLKTQLCLAAPLNSVYFSYDGMVSPCCHLGHKVSRYFQKSCFEPDDFILGDITQTSLQDIWTSPEFRDFRGKFQHGSGPAQCETCYLLYGK